MKQGVTGILCAGMSNMVPDHMDELLAFKRAKPLLSSAQAKIQAGHMIMTAKVLSVEDRLVPVSNFVVITNIHESLWPVADIWNNGYRILMLLITDCVSRFLMRSLRESK